MSQRNEILKFLKPMVIRFSHLRQYSEKQNNSKEISNSSCLTQNITKKEKLQPKYERYNIRKYRIREEQKKLLTNKICYYENLYIKNKNGALRNEKLEIMKYNK